MTNSKTMTTSVRAASLAALVIATMALQAHADRRRGGAGHGAQTIPGVQVKNIGRGTALFDAAGNVLNVTVSDKAIINYDSFNVGEGATVNFIQPGARSRLLNRIDSTTPSFIDGTINANGRIYLVNPSGVLFGPGSVVNAAGFVAAAGQISDSDFRRGKDRFTNLSSGVTNLGQINTTDMAQLVGVNVANFGSIVATNGVVTMSAGESVYIAERGDQIMVRIENPNAQPLDGVTGRSTANATVANAGTISGDSVIFTTGDIYSVAMVDRGGATVNGSRITIGGDVQSQTGDLTIAARDVKVSGFAGFYNDQDSAEVGSQLITDALVNGSEVTLTATGVDAGNGSIEFASALDYTGVESGSLNLIANRDVAVNGEIAGGAGDSLNLSLNADADANFSGAVIIDAPINLGAGDLEITAAHVGIRNEITTTGTITLTPSQEYASVGLGDGAGSFSLKQIELDRIADGASAIIIGDENSRGIVTIENATFRDPVVINTPNAGGEVRVNGALRGVDDASITINGSGNTTYLGSDVTTEGLPILIDDSVIINAGVGLVTIATTDNGNAGADITITGTINNAGADPSGDSLTIDAGSANVDLQGAVGDVSRVFNLIVSGGQIQVTDVFASHSQTYNGDLVINGVMLSTTDIEGAQITINGDTILANDVVIDAVHDAIFNGKVDSAAGEANDLTVNSRRTLFAGRVGGDNRLGTLTTDARGTLYDANGDGVQNDRDLVIVLDEFFTTDAGADVNNDGIVDTADLGLVLDREVTMLGDDVDAETIVFGDPIELFASNVTVTATNSVDFRDTVNSEVYENNSLDVIAPDTRFGGIVGRAETLTYLTTDAQPGSTSIDTTDIYVLGGGATFGDDVTIDTTTVIHGLDSGNVTFQQRVNGPAGLTVETAGVTDFQGAIGDDTALASITTDAPGLTRINGPVANTTGNQTYNDEVRIDGDTEMTAANATFNSTVDSQAGENNDLTINADNTLLAANVGSTQPLGSLITDRPGTTTLGGDVTSAGDRVQFGDDLVLGADVNIINTGAGGVFFNKTVNSDSALTPRDLTVIVDNTVLGNDIPTINFGGNVGVTNALGDLILGGARADVPVVATIIARERGADGEPTGNPLFAMTFRTIGNFNMGQNEKLTTVGSLTIDAGGSAILGDLSVRNNLSVQAPTIMIRAREAGSVLLPNGDLMADEGLEIIAGQLIDFAVAPGVINPANPEPIFSTSTSNISGSLNGFEHVQFGSAITNLNLFLAQPGVDIVLDLSVVAPMIPPDDTNETGRQDPQLRPFEDFVNALHPDSVALNSAGVPATNPALSQMLLRTLGTTLFNDFSASNPANTGVYSGRINTRRLPWAPSTELIAGYAAIAGENNENLAETREILGKAFATLVHQPESEIETALVPGCLTYLRSGEETEAMTDLRTLAVILNAIDEMGLSGFERAVVRSNILGRCRPEGVSEDHFETLVEGYRGAIVEAEQVFEAELNNGVEGATEDNAE